MSGSARVAPASGNTPCTAAESDTFLSRAEVVCEGVLGTFPQGPGPDEKTVVVDPAGLHHIHGWLGPLSAGGASGAIYTWCGLSWQLSFPPDVRAGVQRTADVSIHAYGCRHVLHTVGPDFRVRRALGCDRRTLGISRAEAVVALTSVYKNVFAAFAETSPDLQRMRLPPVSSGIFSGPFGADMPNITAEALCAGFSQLDTEQRRGLEARQLEICVFTQSKHQIWKDALSHAIRLTSVNNKNNNDNNVELQGASDTNSSMQCSLLEETDHIVH